MDTSNYRKFETANPVVRRMIDRFFAQLSSTVGPLRAKATLDAGCGEGETVARLGGLLGGRVTAVDLNPESVRFARARLPEVDVRRESIYELPFSDDAFDLVICLEVLEHLEDPDLALAELARVSSDHVVVSVPHEPWFRLGSLLRGNYVSSLGNHPEHVNHWRHRSLRRQIERRLRVVSLRGSFPWLIAHGRAAQAARETAA